MTVGLLLMVIVALALFIAVSVLLFVVGLLFDAACGDFMAQVIVYGAYVLLWIVPTAALALGWWAHR